MFDSVIVAILFLDVLILPILIKKCINKQIESNKQEDILNKELQSQINRIKYKNKVKMVKQKIEDLKKDGVDIQIAKQISEQVVVQLAEKLVEIDRQEGTLDELYTEKGRKL